MQLEGSNAPGKQFEAFETQMIDPNLATPYTQQWNLNIQWGFKPSWMLELGYAGTKGTKLLTILNSNQAHGHRRGRFPGASRRSRRRASSATITTRWAAYSST